MWLNVPGDTDLDDGDWRTIDCKVTKNAPSSVSDPVATIGAWWAYRFHQAVTTARLTGLSTHNVSGIAIRCLPSVIVTNANPIRSRIDWKTSNAAVKEILKDGTPKWVSHPRDFKRMAQEDYPHRKNSPMRARVSTSYRTRTFSRTTHND